MNQILASLPPVIVLSVALPALAADRDAAGVMVVLAAVDFLKVNVSASGLADTGGCHGVGHALHGRVVAPVRASSN
jgi:hypothetical protein